MAGHAEEKRKKIKAKKTRRWILVSAYLNDCSTEDAAAGPCQCNRAKTSNFDVRSELTCGCARVHAVALHCSLWPSLFGRPSTGTPQAVADEWATAVVAGEAGWPVHVFGGDTKPGLALLCQARTAPSTPELSKARRTRPLQPAPTTTLPVDAAGRNRNPSLTIFDRAAGDVLILFPCRASSDVQCPLSICYSALL